MAFMQRETVQAQALDHLDKPVAVVPESGTVDQAVIDERIRAIGQGHANNLIEGLDAGQAFVEGLIERAREPISNAEFHRREVARLNRQYKTGHHVER